MEDFQSASQGYFLLNDILVRKWGPHGDNFLGKPIVQTVVPQKFRQMVLKTAHDDVAGHVGIRKTYSHILHHFFWLCLKRDVSAYIKTCQLTSKPNQAIAPTPLCPLPVLSLPVGAIFHFYCCFCNCSSKTAGGYISFT